MSKVRAIKEAPKKYHRDLRNIVVTQPSITRDTVRHLATALRRADRYDEGATAEELMNENFAGLDTLRALDKITKIGPDEMSRVKEPADAVKFISGRIIEFVGLLEDHPPDSFDPFHRSLTAGDIGHLVGFLLGWLKEAEDMKNPQPPENKLLK